MVSRPILHFMMVGRALKVSIGLYCLFSRQSWTPLLLAQSSMWWKRFLILLSLLTNRMGQRALHRSPRISLPFKPTTVPGSCRSYSEIPSRCDGKIATRCFNILGTHSYDYIRNNMVGAFSSWYQWGEFTILEPGKYSGAPERLYNQR